MRKQIWTALSRYGAGIAAMIVTILFPPFDPILAAMADCVGLYARAHFEMTLGRPIPFFG